MKKLSLILIIIVCSITSGMAQNQLKIALKNDPKPDVYIDGKKYDASIVELLDQSKIVAVNVIKGEEALEKYDAANGVILISTIKGKGEVKVRTEEKETAFWANNPMVIINGKKSNKEELSKLDPNNIASIDVLKGEKALEQYNAKGGVIIVKTK